MKASATIDINRPIDDVWSYVSDPRNMEQWVLGVSDVRLPEAATDVDDNGAVTLDAGDRFSSKYTYGGRTLDTDYEVVAADEPHRFAMRGEGPFPFEGELLLQPDPDGEGTRVTNVIDAGSDGLFTTVMFTVFRPLMRRMMAKRLREELEALRTDVE